MKGTRASVSLSISKDEGKVLLMPTVCYARASVDKIGDANCHITTINIFDVILRSVLFLAKIIDRNTGNTHLVIGYSYYISIFLDTQKLPALVCFSKNGPWLV